MRLTFPHEKLKGLLIHAESRWPLGLRPTYGEVDPKPGFWLVGDQGVYLMHNGKAHEDMDEQPLVYASECDPTAMAFDHWWQNKRASFGSDDGVEFIEAASVRNAIALGLSIAIDISPDQMVLRTVKLGGDKHEKPFATN